MPDVSTVDTDRFGRLLMHIEQITHRAGWDGAPRLFVIYDDSVPAAERFRPPPVSPSPVALRCGGYAAADALPLVALQPNAANALFLFAFNVATHPDHPAVMGVLRYLRSPVFLGLALMCETWSGRMTPEERENDPRRLVDIPGSIESRMVAALTVDGGMFHAGRTRGAKPTLECWTGEDITGSVFESLRTLVAAISGQPVTVPETLPSAWPS